MSPPAYLLVFTEPGANLPESEFHDWYDNEHIALRKGVAGFQTWTRLVQADGKTPAWAAAYDLASLETLKSAAHVALLTGRSAREKDVLERMHTLDRRAYVLNENAPLRVRDADAATVPGAIMLAASVDVRAEDEADFHKWYDEEHIPALMAVPGWRRSRRFILADAALMGTGGSEYAKKPPKFLGLHEFDSADAFASEEWKKAAHSPWSARTLGSELRIFTVYKRF